MKSLYSHKFLLDKWTQSFYVFSAVNDPFHMVLRFRKPRFFLASSRPPLRTKWVLTLWAFLPFSQISVRTDRQRRLQPNRMVSLPHTGENVTKRIFSLLAIGDRREHTILKALCWEERRGDKVGKASGLITSHLGRQRPPTKWQNKPTDTEKHEELYSVRGNRVYISTSYWAPVPSFMERGWQKSILKVFKD